MELLERWEGRRSQHRARHDWGVAPSTPAPANMGPRQQHRALEIPPHRPYHGPELLGLGRLLQLLISNRFAFAFAFLSSCRSITGIDDVNDSSPDPEAPLEPPSGHVALC